MLYALQQNNKIIVNTDIDGIFSALILHHYLNCEIVGFCNSADIVLYDTNKINSIFDAVYIDMFVPRKDVVCIDQHIVAVDEEHCKNIAALGTKFNPNLVNPRFHTPSQKYYLKYPFATVHYIIANLERNGIELNLNLDAEERGFFFKDLILRADDAMQTTISSKYTLNALQWWNWLKEYSHNGKTITQFMDYLYNSVTSDQLCKKKYAITLFLKEFQCETPDGGFKKNICDKNGYLQNDIKRLVQFLSRISGMNTFDMNMKLETKNGIAKRTELSLEQKDALKRKNCDIFSYAFVLSNEKPNNFSYTLMN